MSLVPDQKLDEYCIVRRLGQGGFGAVYLAQDTLLDRLVAIKELTVTQQTDEQAFKRFLQEARIAGGLNHPNIVTVHALKIDGPNVYPVMEDKRVQMNKAKEDQEDDLLERAIDVARLQKRASISLLQNKLRIGYTRAARLIDLMEEKGIVGPAEPGARWREVL